MDVGNCTSKTIIKLPTLFSRFIPSPGTIFLYWGIITLGLVALFTYGFSNAAERFANEGIPVFTLTNFDTLCEVAAAEGYIGEDDIASIKAFAQNPSEWGANL